jgi:pyridoxal phosphate enzyme (YggS family)
MRANVGGELAASGRVVPVAPRGRYSQDTGERLLSGTEVLPAVRETIEANVREVRERIERACARAGRGADEVIIVGVTKTFGPDMVDALIEAGVCDIGESRIQEFQEKKPRVVRPCRWHLIGTLQRNKAKKAIGEFELIHAVDGLRLADTLNRLGREYDVTTSILLEVNTSGESTKHGFAPDELVTTAGEVAVLPNLRLDGLMTVGPFTDDRERVRRSFEMLRNLRDQVESAIGRPLRHLSMGMSDDFEIAVEEGATMVRLGRVLLGERPGPAPTG